MKTNMITVEVVRETKKAVLVRSQGREAWVQKRHLRDGQVSERVWDSALAWAEEQREAREREREARERRRVFRIARTTDRAVATTARVYFAGGEDDRLVWFAKSVVQIESDDRFSAPGWLVLAKQEEIKEGPVGGSYYETHRWCKGERPVVVGWPLEVETA